MGVPSIYVTNVDNAQDGNDQNWHKRVSVQK